jgi:hypothetical protein
VYGRKILHALLYRAYGPRTSARSESDLHRDDVHDDFDRFRAPTKCDMFEYFTRPAVYIVGTGGFTPSAVHIMEAYCIRTAQYPVLALADQALPSWLAVRKVSAE